MQKEYVFFFFYDVFWSALKTCEVGSTDWPGFAALPFARSVASRCEARELLLQICRRWHESWQVMNILLLISLDISWSILYFLYISCSHLSINPFLRNALGGDLLLGDFGISCALDEYLSFNRAMRNFSPELLHVSSCFHSQLTELPSRKQQSKKKSKTCVRQIHSQGFQGRDALLDLKGSWRF